MKNPKEVLSNFRHDLESESTIEILSEVVPSDDMLEFKVKIPIKYWFKGKIDATIMLSARETLELNDFQITYDKKWLSGKLTQHIIIWVSVLFILILITVTFGLFGNILIRPSYPPIDLLLFLTSFMYFFIACISTILFTCTALGRLLYISLLCRALFSFEKGVRSIVQAHGGFSEQRRTPLSSSPAVSKTIYEDEILNNPKELEALLELGEEIKMVFFALYHIKNYGVEFKGTWAATNRRFLFLGVAKRSDATLGEARWRTFRKKKIITIPYVLVTDFYYSKQKLRIDHTREHEGKKPGKVRKITIMPIRLEYLYGGQKESEEDWVARSATLFENLKKLRMSILNETSG